MSTRDRPHGGRRGRRRLAFCAVAFVTGIVAALVIGEVVARLVTDDDALFDRKDRWVEHATLGRVLRPDHEYTARGVHYSVNSLHLRDRAYPTQKTDGVLRVGVVGDSFVFGIGPLETIFPKVVEARLGGAAEVMSIGMPGYGTLQQNRFLREFMTDHEIDIVVLAFCVGNDITENARVLSGKRPEARPRPDGFLARHSRLYGAYRRARRDLAKAGEAKYLEFVERRMRLARPAYYGGKGAAAYAETLASVGSMREWAAERGAGFAVLLLTDEYQLDRSLRDRVHTVYGTHEEGLDPVLVQRRLTADLGAVGIPVIDPIEAFRAAYESGRYFIPADTHYDEAGNALVADALESFLRARYPDELDGSE